MAECMRNGEFNRTDPNEVVLKEIEKRTVVYVRGFSELTSEAFMKQVKKLDVIIKNNNILSHEPTMSIFYLTLDDYSTSCEYEILKSAKNYSGCGKECIKDISEGLYASIIHKGPISGLRKTFIKMYDLLKEMNYTALYYPLYIHHVGLLVPETEMITEIQLPVKKSN
jgi:effector-binding domain-containing protein